MMDVFSILLALPAGAWALSRIVFSASGVVRANRLRTHELKRAEESPGLSSGPSEPVLRALQRADADALRAAREDYALTGAVLAGMGAVAMFGGRAAAYGQWAVGLYTAGTLAIVAGVGLAIFGAVLRLLARPILDPPAQNRSAS
jgi:hypothetical protein